MKFALVKVESGVFEGVDYFTRREKAEEKKRAIETENSSLRVKSISKRDAEKRFMEVVIIGGVITSIQFVDEKEEESTPEDTDIVYVNLKGD